MCAFYLVLVPPTLVESAVCYVAYLTPPACGAIGLRVMSRGETDLREKYQIFTVRYFLDLQSILTGHHWFMQAI